VLAARWSYARLRGALQIQPHLKESGPTRFALSVAPYRDVYAYGLATERCAAITITEIAPRAGEGFEAHLMAIFKLSEAEAKLASDLVSGFGVSESAARRAVTVKTARTYLSRVFRKTGARQQSQLVAMLKDVHPLAVTSYTDKG
jgi:DNA-binding CsgD family transcriptional regulator